MEIMSGYVCVVTAFASESGSKHGVILKTEHFNKVTPMALSRKGFEG